MAAASGNQVAPPGARAGQRPGFAALPAVQSAQARFQPGAAAGERAGGRVAPGLPVLQGSASGLRPDDDYPGSSPSFRSETSLFGTIPVRRAAPAWMGAQPPARRAAGHFRCRSPGEVCARCARWPPAPPAAPRSPPRRRLPLDAAAFRETAGVAASGAATAPSAGSAPAAEEQTLLTASPKPKRCRPGPPPPPERPSRASAVRPTGRSGSTCWTSL